MNTTDKIKAIEMEAAIAIADTLNLKRSQIPGLLLIIKSVCDKVGNIRVKKCLDDGLRLSKIK